jgi:hypothetical protein
MNESRGGYAEACHTSPFRRRAGRRAFACRGPVGRSPVRPARGAYGAGYETEVGIGMKGARRGAIAAGAQRDCVLGVEGKIELGCAAVAEPLKLGVGGAAL